MGGAVPSSKKPRKSIASRSRGTQSAQRRSAARKKTSLRRYRLTRAAGWALVGLAIVVGTSHWLAHLGLWDFASQGLMDLLAGYPMALVLGVGGAVTLSKS